jgi:Animal haem peroxidase
MFEQLIKSIESAGGSAIDGWAWLSGEASAAVVNETVACTWRRPHPWSTVSDYTSWQALTDRTYLSRHLPAATVPVMPPWQDVQALFKRPAGKQRLSGKSTCLFPAFAQYLTDGFIRTDPTNPAKTTSNHEIDLCPLYGRTLDQTTALRLRDDTAGYRGRLKSQMIRGEEYPPFLFQPGTKTVAPQFAVLDPPLFASNQSAPFPAGWPDWPQPKLDTIFAIGGDRANSTPFTAMMNTLLLREHNRVAGELETRNPTWNDERVFQVARNIMIPIFITIVIEQYINHITPLPFSLRADPTVAWTAAWNRPNWISTEFSLLYRWHSLMPDAIAWTDRVIPISEFTLDNAPLLSVGLDAAFSAAAAQTAADLGAFNTADSLLPIEQLSITQARANRLDTYNNYRKQFGMKPAAAFTDISKNPAVIGELTRLYGHPDNVEFYPGLFAEDRAADSPLPQLLLRMVAVDAFTQALTNPLLSEHVFNADTFTPWGLDTIHNTSKLGDILARNVPVRGPTAIEMTLPTWHYADGP